MSSTRKTNDRSAFHQNRYASSQEFERGLLANLVAKRCAVLNSINDRELIWFLQAISHAEGGFAGLLDALAEKFPKQFEQYEIPGFSRTDSRKEIENYIKRVCLDPATELKGLSYFRDLIKGLREYQASYIKTKSAGFSTALGNKVWEVLDYTYFSDGLTLMEGEARTGKSFAARSWCDQRPGLARFVEVPPGNDDSGFFRALARGLGLGNFLQYKACEIRDRVESVLLTGDLVLVLDEAQRLWPQQNLRYGFPRRIVWVMTMANAGVPIAMISTPQFLTIQKAVEKSGWNGAQLTGRIKHYERLPSDISEQDLIAVAKSVLPEANRDALRAIVVYARSSARYLAAIDSISTRARYLAMKAGRSTATTTDVRTAMQESVIPGDARLQEAMEMAGRQKNAAASSAGAPLAETNLRLPRKEFLKAIARLISPREHSNETPLVGA